MIGVKWFIGSARQCPIGVDFGAESLKVVQLAREDGQLRIVAAGRRQVPDSMAGDPGARSRFFADAIKELLTRHPFKGKRVVTSIPAESLFVQHIRLARMSEPDLVKALPWEAQGKLPFPVRDAVLRHLVAGEIFLDNETRNEVILMAAPRPAVEAHLSAIARAKLDVQAVLVPPLAMLEAFRFLFTRSDEKDMCTFFIDIGAAQTCAMITHATKIVFVKQIPTAGHVINAAVATRLNCSRAQARRLRIEMIGQANPQAATGTAESASPKLKAADGSAVPGQATATSAAAATMTETPPQTIASAACREEVARLARELTFCSRYYQSLFPDRPLERIVFLGGEAHHRAVCQQIARELRLPAQLGDPMLRMHRTHEAVDCGDLTPGTPAPEWAVAFGCSLSDASGGQ